MTLTKRDALGKPYVAIKQLPSHMKNLLDEMSHVLTDKGVDAGPHELEYISDEDYAAIKQSLIESKKKFEEFKEQSKMLEMFFNDFERALDALKKP